MSDVNYVFTVTASKGVDDAGAAAWSQLRSDNASCTVSTTAVALPHVSINPKVIKQGPRPMHRIESRCMRSNQSHGSVLEAKQSNLRK